jgi:hypothetical protein
MMSLRTIMTHATAGVPNSEAPFDLTEPQAKYMLHERWWIPSMQWVETRRLWFKKSQPYNRPTNLGQAWVLRAGAFVLESRRATDQCWLILAAKKYWPRAFSKAKGQASLHICSPSLLCFMKKLNTLVAEGNKQANRGIKLMAKWWRNKSNLVHQPCCSASAWVTGCQALGPGLANLCACAGLP